MNSSAATIRPVLTKKDRKAFVDFAWDVYKNDPAWIPPLKDEVHGLITPGKNPWFEHARAQLWLAELHGTNGLRTIINDYAVRDTTRFWLKMLLYTSAFLVLVLGTLVIFTFDPNMK